MRTPFIVPTLQRYQASWLRPDVIAGLTLVAIAVPEQMATARLANMPAVTGLYAFVAASLLFVLLGTNRQMSVGADSTIAPVFAAGVAALVAVGSPQYSHLVTFLALMVGALLIAVGLLRLGWIADFLSIPVVTGVLAGIAVEIVVRQLPAVLGLAGGGTTTIGRVEKVADQIGHTNGWAVAIAAAVLGVIVVTEKLDRRIPGALIGLVGSIIVVGAAGLKNHGVRVVGSIHGGLPSFGIGSIRMDDVRHLAAPALTVAFVCIVQTAATVRASGHADSDSFDRDLIALGAGNVAAGLSGAFPVNSSPPRTAVVAAAGGNSQLTSLVAAAVALGVVLFATGALKDLPTATLGAILLFVATRLLRIKELKAILRFARFEFGLAVATALAVSFVGIEQGVIVAVLAALAQRTRMAARPRDAVLGREPGTPHWIPTDIGRPTEQVPGVVVYLLYAALWYGNADYVVDRIREILASAAQPVKVFVLDANGMSDLDYTGARAMGVLASELAGRGITFGITRASHVVHHDLKHSGLLKDIKPENVFTSVEEAVDALCRGSGGKEPAG